MLELLEQVDHWSPVDLRTSSNMEVKDIENREEEACIKEKKRKKKDR
jgi:hypothetical protein